MEHIPCNNCGSPDYSVKYFTWNPQNSCLGFRESGNARGTQQIVSCTQCGLEYVNPRLTNDEILALYSGAAEDVYLEGQKGRELTFRRCVDFIESFNPPGKRLLDVGAATGFFLKQAQRMGWEVQGVELNHYRSEWGRSNLGIPIFAGDLSKYARTSISGRYDVVTMWDMIEHSPNPTLELCLARDLLNEDGLLVVNTPNVGSWMAKLFGKHWWFYIPQHLYYFTPKTLSDMLERAGYEVLSVTPYYPALPLGHLANMAALYSPSISRATQILFQTTGLAQKTVRYYAAQMNIVARTKPATQNISIA